eukprot:COSAG01_NODE_71650_length_255_cov_0.666667_1_plen_47_part_10
MLFCELLGRAVRGVLSLTGSECRWAAIWPQPPRPHRLEPHPLPAKAA